MQGFTGERRMVGMRKIVATKGAPGAIGPYSQGVVVTGKRMVFTSGQIGLDPVSGVMVEGGVRAQAEQVMKNLGAVLEASGMKWSDVARSTIYLADMGDFAVVNEVYGAVFPADPPARATIQAAGLPKGALVEIDVVAVADE